MPLRRSRCRNLEMIRERRVSADVTSPFERLITIEEALLVSVAAKMRKP